MVRSIRSWFIVFGCIAVAAGIWGFRFSYWVFPQLEVELQVNTYTDVEIYYDSGRGFSEEQRIRFDGSDLTENSDDFFEYKAIFPVSEIRGVRIDPAKQAGPFAIGSIVLLSGGEKQSLQGAALLQRIKSTNGIVGLTVRDGLVIGKAVNKDPYLVVTTQNLEMAYTSFWLRVLVGLGIGGLVLAGLGFIYISPAVSILTVSIFCLLSVVQAQQLVLTPLVTNPFFNDIRLAGNLGCAVGLTVVLTRMIRRWQKAMLDDAVNHFLFQLYLILGALLLGIWLGPAFWPLTWSLVLLVVATSNLECSRQVKGVLQTLVDDKEVIDSNWVLPTKIVLLGFLACLIIDRAPSLFTDPRIWAEDGRHTLHGIFFYHGWKGIFWYDEYFRIMSNIAGVLSTRVFELEAAAYIFTSLAFFVKLLPFLLVIWGRSTLWNTVAKKSLVCLLILYAPTSEEIWLNVNGCHYYMTLVTILLLPEIEVTLSRFGLGCRLFLLGVASMAGILPCAMTPLYYMRGLQIRNKKTLAAAIVLTLGGALQYYLLATAEGSVPVREGITTLNYAGWIVVIKTVLLPLSESWAQQVSTSLGSGSGLLRIGNILLFGYVGIALGLFWFLRKNTVVYFLAAGLGLVGLALVFGLGGPLQVGMVHPFAGNRYFYAPNVLLWLTLLGGLQQLQHRLGVFFASATVVVCCSFLLSLNTHQFYERQVIFKELPTWQTELRRWRQEPGYTMQLWPANWTVNLNAPL